MFMMDKLYLFLIGLVVVGQLEARVRPFMHRDPCSKGRLCNGGNCRAIKGGGYTCQCPEGLKGKNCQIKVSGCMDYNDSCASWARNGECTENPKYMNAFCPRSCGRCSQD